MKVQKESRAISLLVLTLSLEWGWIANSTPRPLYPWGKAPVPIAQEARGAPGSV